VADKNEGLWEFGGDLFVVVGFDGKKPLKDLEFVYTLTWIRVFDLSLGLMNDATGKEITNKVGKTLVDTNDDGSTVGGYLRIEVKLDIGKALLCGVMMMDQ
jgi:hypothetical protein